MRETHIVFFLQCLVCSLCLQKARDPKQYARLRYLEEVKRAKLTEAAEQNG